MTEVTAKARRLLEETRLHIVSTSPDTITATVLGDSGTEWRLGLSRDGAFGWCSCPSTADCSHLTALRIQAGLQPADHNQEDPMDNNTTPPTTPDTEELALDNADDLDPTRPFEDPDEAPGDRHTAMEVPDAGPAGDRPFGGNDRSGVGGSAVDVVPVDEVLSPDGFQLGTELEPGADLATVDKELLPISTTPVTLQTLKFISKTDFVPRALRGNPAAILACVKYGSEMGLSPMESLTSVDVIDGRPSPSAELLGRLIRAAGHRVEVLEHTETVCRLRGTRVDTEETMEVAFTMAEAEKATAKEGGRYVPLSETRRYREYPSDMLFARALSRLHRRLFPDATKLEDPATRGG